MTRSLCITHGTLRSDPMQGSSSALTLLDLEQLVSEQVPVMGFLSPFSSFACWDSV